LKLTIGLAAALLVWATTAQAQVSVGVKAGFSLADLSITDAGDTFEPTNRTGLVAGVFVIVPTKALVAFQPEVLVSMQGAKVSDLANSGTIKLDYLQVPLLARIKPSKSPVGLLVGPSIGYRIRAKLTADGLSSEEQDLDEQVKKSDLGFVAGAAIDFAHIVIDARYIWGLTNINDDSTDTSKIKNRVAQITLGFRF
jgi:hypothetical protein